MTTHTSHRPRTELPLRRFGSTIGVGIGGERFYLTTNADDSGTLGEVFIRWGGQGATAAGLLDGYAIALSLALQYDVPLPELLDSGLGQRFEPNGATTDPEVPRVRSVTDYVARRLALDWLPPDPGRR